MKSYWMNVESNKLLSVFKGLSVGYILRISHIEVHKFNYLPLLAFICIVDLRDGA